MSINTDHWSVTRLLSGMLKLLLLFLSCFSLSVKRQVWCILDGKRRDEVKSRSVGWIRTKRSLRSRRCLLTFFACFLPQTQLASLRTCIHSERGRGIERHWRADEGEIWGWATSTEVHPIKTIGTGKVPPCNSFSLWIYIFDSSTFSNMTWNAKITIWWG